MALRIMIADDHGIVRRGLRALLALQPDFSVVGEAADGAEAVKLARELRPDIVLMDRMMPQLDGVTATACIVRDAPDTAVLILTSVFDDEQALGAVRAGAIGYLLKDADEDELVRAVRGAAAGQVQLTPQAAALLLREVRLSERAGPLTERERDVLRLVARGQTNKEIARALRIGDKTIKSHVSNILTKLGAQSRTQAALHAVRLGLVAPGEVGHP